VQEEREELAMTKSLTKQRSAHIEQEIDLCKAIVPFALQQLRFVKTVRATLNPTP
jgi:hypothetical protein